MKNKIDDLRNHMFATIEALLDDDNPMDIQRAKAVSNAAQVIVNSAKVEVDFVRATGSKGTGFLPAPDDAGSVGDGVVQPIKNGVIKKVTHKSSWQ